ncbi:MAG TPA: Trp biosynthesis-associated membrane protein [Pseudonocardiaceae bacterium]|nr:Trp biosynthesis-associated membrane protein [Pseudonocardiaceae bacterium]
MREGRRAFVVTIALLVAASIALGAAAMLGWAQVGFQVPLRGIVEVRVPGSEVVPVLTPLAVFALAAVAAMLATGGWARWSLGALLLIAAAPPAFGALRMTDESWLTETAVSTAGLPARSVPAGTATVLAVGPGFAAAGAVLLAAAGAALVVRGHRMPRLGRKYQKHPDHPSTLPENSLEGRLWERMDAGEDPTAPGHPR